MNGRRILLISPECWSDIFVSKHNYAVHLAAFDNSVYFLNPPTNQFGLKSTKFNDLFEIDYTGFFRGIRFAPRTLRRILVKQVFKKLEKKIGHSIDVVWSFDNSVFFDFDALPEHVLKISHIVDLNMNYELELASSTADVCFYSTSTIGKLLKAFNTNSFFIHHGYSPMRKEEVSITSISASTNVKAGYTGNLDIKYLDWNLIELAVERNSNVDFFFAGKCESPGRLSWFEKTSNVTYVGILDQQSMLSFIEHMDVLLLAYLADEHKEQLSNPHKVMEYLGSGKPVVATFTSEYASSDILYMSKTNDEWIPLFEKVVNDITIYSSQDLIDKRKRYAYSNTYEKQIERIDEIISNLDLWKRK